MIDLPGGWSAAILYDLIDADGVFSDGDWVESKDQDPQGRIRLLQLADVGDGVFRDKSSRFVNEEQFERLRCTEIFERDVLIARMPDPLGRACLAPPLSQRCITVVDVAIVRPGASSVHSGWLMYALNTPTIRSRIGMESSGTTRRRITRKKLARLDFPVPPLNEQRRIADKLDAVLARVHACRERLDRVPAILKRFRQSVLAAATSDKLTEDWRASRAESVSAEVLLERLRSQGRKRKRDEIVPQFTDLLPAEWTWAQVKDVGGVQLGRQRSPKYHSGPNMRPYLRVMNVKEGYIDTDDIMEMVLR